jgi:hypothetical protein
LKRRRARRPTVIVSAAVVALLVIAVLAIVVVTHLSSSSTGNGVQPDPSASATIDPRLILQRRALPVTAKLGAHVEVVGTLYPSIPGPNTLSLKVHGATAKTEGPRISITMPGMRMVPIMITLAPKGDAYSGTVQLPMLGYYQAVVSLVVGTQVVTGTMQLAVPL